MKSTSASRRSAGPGQGTGNHALDRPRKLRGTTSFLCVVGFILSGLVWFELKRVDEKGKTNVDPLSRAEEASGSPSTADDGDAQRQERVAAILRRPLFSPDRQPAPSALTKGAGLPRLAGIVVAPSGKRALFVAMDGHGSVEIEEGGRLGPYTMQSIEAGQITVDGPAGRRVLHPAFAEASAEQSAALLLLPPLRPPPRPPMPWSPRARSQ